MKTGFKKILFFLCNLISISIAFKVFNRFNFIEWFGLSFIICYFYTKNILDKTDFENKINELKDELKSFHKKH